LIVSSSPTWSQIKSRLSPLGKEDLLNIIKDLYRLNGDNKVFLTSRLMSEPSHSLAEPYRRAIRREFNPDRGLPRLNLQAARKALTAFKNASANPSAVIDMLIYYVEQGVACTRQYGDIHEQFYRSLESAFEEAVSLVRDTGSPEIVEKFRPRLERIVGDTSGIGWGFHDYLSDVYYNDYPAE
jgi:hypothetical protein